MKPTTSIEFEAAWRAKLPTWRSHQALRDHLYGIRVEDDPHKEHAGDFAVCCPTHGWIGDELTILQARSLQAEHLEVHSEQPATTPI